MVWVVPTKRGLEMQAQKLEHRCVLCRPLGECFLHSFILKQHIVYTIKNLRQACIPIHKENKRTGVCKWTPHPCKPPLEADGRSEAPLHNSTLETWPVISASGPGLFERRFVACVLERHPGLFLQEYDSSSHDLKISVIHSSGSLLWNEEALRLVPAYSVTFGKSLGFSSLPLKSGDNSICLSSQGFAAVITSTTPAADSRKLKLIWSTSYPDCRLGTQAGIGVGLLSVCGNSVSRVEV